MNLAEKMIEWARITSQADALKSEIEQEVTLLGRTQSLRTEFGEAVASYRKNSSNGSYDWQAIVQELEPEQAIVDKYTTTTVDIDYKAIAEECNADNYLKTKYYSAPVESKPSVSLKLKK